MSSWPLSDLALGAWLGIGMVFCLYNMLVGLLLKQRWLVVIILPGAGFLSVEWAFFMAPPELFQITGLGQSTSLSLFGMITTASTILMASLFTRRFLHLENRAPTIDRVLKYVGITTWIAGLMVFILPPTQFTQLFYGVVVCCALAATYAHWQIWKLGAVLDRLIGASWILMGPAFLAWFGRNLGVLPNSEAVTYTYLTGFLGNLLVLSLSSIYALKDANQRVVSGLKRVQRQKVSAQKYSANLTRELEVQQNRLARQKELIQIEYRNKEALFRLISHDIRGPLAHAEQAVDRVIETTSITTDSGPAKLLAYTLDSLQQTVSTLDRLMDIEALTHQSRVRHAEPVLLSALVNGQLDKLQAHADQQRVQLINQIPSEFLLRSDTLMLETLIDSLVSNAIKHTAVGGEVVISASHESNEKVLISVANTSNNLNTDQLKKIEQALSIEAVPTAESAAPANYDGLGSGRGAGLFLTKRLLQANDGQLTHSITTDRVTLTAHLPLPKLRGVLFGFSSTAAKQCMQRIQGIESSAVLTEASKAADILQLVTRAPVSFLLVYLNAHNHEQGLHLIENLRRDERMTHTQIAFYAENDSPHIYSRRMALRYGADLEIHDIESVDSLQGLLGYMDS